MRRSCFEICRSHSGTVEAALTFRKIIVPLSSGCEGARGWVAMRRVVVTAVSGSVP